jgi:hypothetical protein
MTYSSCAPLEKRLLGDPSQEREELRRIFRDGRITLRSAAGRLLHRPQRNPASGPTNATALRGEPGRAVYSE